MDQQRIKQLIDLLADSDLSEIILSEGGSMLTLTRQSAATPASAPVDVAQTPIRVPAADSPGVLPEVAVTEAAPASVDAGSTVRSPLYGILHLTPAPNEPPFVAEGDSVQQGQTLCIVEAMKMFHEVKTSKSGRVDSILATAGDEVESGQSLFQIV